MTFAIKYGHVAVYTGAAQNSLRNKRPQLACGRIQLPIAAMQKHFGHVPFQRMPCRQATVRHAYWEGRAFCSLTWSRERPGGATYASAKAMETHSEWPHWHLQLRNRQAQATKSAPADGATPGKHCSTCSPNWPISMHTPELRSVGTLTNNLCWQKCYLKVRAFICVDAVPLVSARRCRPNA